MIGKNRNDAQHWQEIRNDATVWFGANYVLTMLIASLFLSFLQGTGRYAIYIANYASGNVGPHALIEMDESASDLSQGVIALSNVAEEAGVNKFTGECEERSGWLPCSRFPPVKGRLSFLGFGSLERRYR